MRVIATAIASGRWHSSQTHLRAFVEVDELLVPLRVRSLLVKLVKAVPIVMLPAARRKPSHRKHSPPRYVYGMCARLVLIREANARAHACKGVDKLTRRTHPADLIPALGTAQGVVGLLHLSEALRCIDLLPQSPSADQTVPIGRPTGAKPPHLPRIPRFCCE